MKLLQLLQMLKLLQIITIITNYYKGPKSSKIITICNKLLPSGNRGVNREKLERQLLRWDGGTWTDAADETKGQAWFRSGKSEDPTISLNDTR